MSNRKNAGCYRVMEDGTIVDVTDHVMKVIGEDKMPDSVVDIAVRLILLYATIIFVAFYLSACGNWQVHFGVSEYNQNRESRSFNEETTSNRKR